MSTFLQFEKEVLKAQKRSIYICFCVWCSTVVFHPINACIAIKCYNSPRNFAIPVVDFVLSALWLSNNVDEIFHCSVKVILHFKQVHLGWIFCCISHKFGGVFFLYFPENIKLYIILRFCALLSYWWLDSICKLHMYPVHIIHSLDWTRSSKIVITGLELPCFLWWSIRCQQWTGSNAWNLCK